MKMVKKKLQKNPLLWIILLLIILFLLASYQPQEAAYSPLDTDVPYRFDLPCEHYNIPSEYIQDFSTEWYNDFLSTCNGINPGGFTSERNELSCDLDDRGSHSCNGLFFEKFEEECDSLNADYSCTSTYVGCTCQIDSGNPCDEIKWLDGDKHDCLDGECSNGQECVPDLGTGWCDCAGEGDCAWHYIEETQWWGDSSHWECYGDCPGNTLCDVTDGINGYLDCTCMSFDEENGKMPCWELDIPASVGDKGTYCRDNGQCTDTMQTCQHYWHYNTLTHECGCLDYISFPDMPGFYCGQYCYIYAYTTPCTCPPDSNQILTSRSTFYCVPNGHSCNFGAGDNTMPGTTGTIT